MSFQLPSGGNMSEEDKLPDQEHGQAIPEEGDSSAKALTRRQFLIGAGAGLVAGVAGTAGVLATAQGSRPAEAPTTAQTTNIQPSAPAAQQPVAQAASSDLPATHRRVTLNIDGMPHDIIVDVRWSLWEAMTFQLGMSSSNLGCDRAQCGACTVVVDGLAVNGCTVLAARLGRGQKILTVDGISKGASPEKLHPVAKAYWQEGGFQCGICTRGFIMSTYALLTANATPSEDEVREALSGNICRCSEYPKIYESVFRAAEDMRKKA
jgi:aerobic-type carbon monoxide dehydrogenase small subunit (CoxS/CutS family)